MKRLIAIISILLSIIGICSIFLIPIELWQFKGFVATVDLYNIEINNQHFENVNELNLFLYVLWLMGGLLYFFSNYRELRLLRFTISFIFIYKLIAFPMRIYGTYVFLNAPPNEKNTFEYIYILIAGYFIYQILFLYGTYQSLIFLKKSKPIQLIEKINSNTTSSYPLEANRWQRFLNFTIDTIVWYSLYLSHYELFKRFVFFQDTIDTWESNDEIHYIPILILISSRWLYYTIFELLFRATPAKMLSETSVLNSMGAAATSAQILKRNILRLVPFNSLTFLFGYDLHDSNSNTKIYREERTGASGVIYLMLVPTLIVVCFSIYFGIKKYDSLKDIAWQKEIFKERLKTIHNNLDHISKNDIIVLNSYGETKNKRYTLKVIAVNGNQINCQLNNPEHYISTDREILERYNTKINSTNHIVLNRVDLEKAIIQRYENLPCGHFTASLTHKLKQLNLMKTKEAFFIDTILSLDQPMLHFDLSLVSANFLGLTITNYGIPSEITAIESNDKEVKWELDNCNLPVEIPNVLRKLNNSSVHPFEIIIKGEKEAINTIDFTISVRDSLGITHQYQVSGEEKNFNALIKELK